MLSARRANYGLPKIKTTLATLWAGYGASILLDLRLIDFLLFGNSNGVPRHLEKYYRRKTLSRSQNDLAMRTANRAIISFQY